MRAGIPDAFCRLSMYDAAFKKIGQVFRTLSADNGRSFEPQWQDQECYLYTSLSLSLFLCTIADQPLAASFRLRAQE
jgi:hypothetical protein